MAINPFDPLFFDYTHVFPEQPPAPEIAPAPPTFGAGPGVFPNPMQGVIPPQITPQPPAPQSSFDPNVIRAAIAAAAPPPAPQMPGLGLTPGPSGVPGITFEEAAPSGQVPGITPQPADDLITRSRTAIQRLESGGRPQPYSTVVPSMSPTRGRQEALGAYGIMDFNLAEWSRAALGRVVSREEFLNNPALQDAIFNHRFGILLAEERGDAGRAAQRWFAGSLTNRAPDRFGTTGDVYRNRFLSILGQPTGPEAAGPPAMIPSPFSGATGGPEQIMSGFGPQLPAAPAPPAPFSPTSTAMAPGLGQPRHMQATGPVANFLDATMLTPRTGIAEPGTLVGLLNRMRGAVPPVEYSREVQEGAAAIFFRGQQLRVENPNATPAQLTQMLIRDPVFGQNALRLGTNGPAVLAAAVGPPTGPPTFQTVGPGQALVRNEGGQLFDTGIAQPPPEAQLMQWLMSLPPEQRNIYMQLMAARRATQPSDREQAWERLRLQNPEFYTPEMRDLFLANAVKQEPIVNNFGQVVGFRWVNAITNEPIGPSTNRVTGVEGQLPPVAPGVAGPTPGVTPPTPGVGPPQVPGVTLEGQPYTPGMDITPEMIQGLGGMGALPTPLSSMFAGTGGPAGPAGPAPRTTPPPIDTGVRVVGRAGERDVEDAPGLSLSTSQLTNPAHMFLGAGPESAFRGAWGRVMGNIPGYERSEEAALRWQSALQDFRASYASYVRGTRLAGEHQEVMRNVPSPGEIFTNPLRSINQGIIIREGLIRDLRLAMQHSRDQDLDTTTRKAASDRIVEIRNLLSRLPTLQALHNLADQVREGARVSGEIPSVGERIEELRGGVDTLTGRRSSLPGNLNELELPDLQRLAHPSRSRTFSTADRNRLTDAIRSKLGLVPISR